MNAKANDREINEHTNEILKSHFHWLNINLNDDLDQARKEINQLMERFTSDPDRHVSKLMLKWHKDFTYPYSTWHRVRELFDVVNEHPQYKVRVYAHLRVKEAEGRWWGHHLAGILGILSHLLNDKICMEANAEDIEVINTIHTKCQDAVTQISHLLLLSDYVSAKAANVLGAFRVAYAYSGRGDPVARYLRHEAQRKLRDRMDVFSQALKEDRIPMGKLDFADLVRMVTETDMGLKTCKELYVEFMEAIDYEHPAFLGMNHDEALCSMGVIDAVYARIIDECM